MTQVIKNAATAISLPEQVRQAAAWVAANAQSVRIDHEKIPGYTAMLLDKYPIITGLDPAHHFLSQASPAATAAYVLALDSVNFGSGYFPVAHSHGLPLEYNHVAGALKSAFAESRLNTPQKWAEAHAADCHDIFAIPLGLDAQLDELMQLFATHLQVTGEQLVKNYDGEVLNLLESAGNSAVALAETVATWPTFRDIAQFKGRDVPLFKRAQILAADMYLAFGGRAPAAFTDMASLTNFPDNMVPHVLRCDGIISYTPELSALIDGGVTLAACSGEEAEIRAIGLHVVELMKSAAHAAGRDVTSVNLDHILWNRGYEAELYKKPAHRTFSVWY